MLMDHRSDQAKTVATARMLYGRDRYEGAAKDASARAISASQSHSSASPVHQRRSEMRDWPRGGGRELGASRAREGRVRPA